MESVRSLSGPTSTTRVNDRKGSGGSKQQADAFRRALQGEAGDDGAATAADEGPVRTGLQHRPVIGRREAETAQHVDVIA